MSDDIKNFREAVAKFDELKLELEDLKEGLENNFENYKNVSDISSDIAEKNQGVLESINTLQINATDTVEDAIKKATDLKTEMSKYYSAENTKITSEFNTVKENIETQINTLESTFKTAVNNAVNNVNIDIDTTDIVNTINEKIDQLNLDKVDDFITGMNVTSAEMTDEIIKLEESETKLDIKIKNRTEKIDKAVENFNGINRSVTMAMTLSMLFVGIVIGAGLMAYFKIDAVSDFYFAQYEKRLKMKKSKRLIDGGDG